MRFIEIELARSMQQKGWRIRHLILGTGSVGERDRANADDLVIEGKEVFYSEDLDDISRAIGECTALASMKFHGSVVATMYGVPSMVLIPTSKNRSFMRRIGREDLLSVFDDKRLTERRFVRGETKAREHVVLRHPLAVEIGGAVRLAEESVALGIPLARVDAVQDADEPFPARTKDAVEAEPELRRLNFLGIPGAHCRNRVRIDEAGFQKADAPPVLETIRHVDAARQIEACQPVAIEVALIREVVNREHAWHPTENGMIGV